MAFKWGQLRRSTDGVVAGVCGGFAERLSIDVGALRFAVVALSLVTGGLFAGVYIIFWIVLPAEAGDSPAVEVRPDSVDSFTYGKVGERARRSREVRRDSRSHTPPVPPQRDEDVLVYSQTSNALIAVGVGLGVLLASGFFVFFAAVLDADVGPACFWALLVICLGFVRLVLPGHDGYRVVDFLVGVALLCAGVLLALHAFGFVRIEPFAWIRQVWPLLAICAGLVVLWHATGLNGFALAAMAAMVLASAACVLFCSDPGPTLLYFGGDGFFPTDFPPVDLPLGRMETGGLV